MVVMQPRSKPQQPKLMEDIFSMDKRDGLELQHLLITSLFEQETQQMVTISKHSWLPRALKA